MGHITCLISSSLRFVRVCFHRAYLLRARLPISLSLLWSLGDSFLCCFFPEFHQLSSHLIYTCYLVIFSRMSCIFVVSLRWFWEAITSWLFTVLFGWGSVFLPSIFHSLVSSAALSLFFFNGSFIFMPRQFLLMPNTLDIPGLAVCWTFPGAGRGEQETGNRSGRTCQDAPLFC